MRFPRFNSDSPSSCFHCLLVTAVLGAMCSIANAQLDNLGATLFYNHNMSFFDTVNNETEVRNEFERLTAISGSEPIPQFPAAATRQSSGTLSQVQGDYAFDSTGSYDRMDLRGSSAISFVANEKGSYDPETAPDGVWDYMKASNYNSLIFNDQLTIERIDGQPADEMLSVLFRWNSGGNELASLSSAYEEFIGHVENLGDITDLQNGFSGNTGLFDRTLRVVWRRHFRPLDRRLGYVRRREADDVRPFGRHS